jgi:hypothetical protein
MKLTAYNILRLALSYNEKPVCEQTIVRIDDRMILLAFDLDETWRVETWLSGLKLAEKWEKLDRDGALAVVNVIFGRKQ